MMDARLANLIRATMEDLEHLGVNWSPTIETATLRRESVIIRRLLLDGDYSRAWRGIGLEREPTVQFPDLVRRISTLPLQQVRFATAGGSPVTYRSGGATITMTSIAALDIQGTPPQGWRNDIDSMGEAGIHAFAESTCLITMGTPVKRREVIQYVAHALGGAHTDDPRREEPQHNALMARVQGLRFPMPKMLLNGIEIGGMDHIYQELLSTGFWLGKSTDAQRFISVAAKAL